MNIRCIELCLWVVGGAIWVVLFALAFHGEKQSGWHLVVSLWILYSALFVTHLYLVRCVTRFYREWLDLDRLFSYGDREAQFRFVEQRQPLRSGSDVAYHTVSSDSHLELV
jgi:hypothetical protein